MEDELLNQIFVGPMEVVVFRRAQNLAKKFASQNKGEDELFHFQQKRKCFSALQTPGLCCANTCISISQNVFE